MSNCKIESAIHEELISKYTINDNLSRSEAEIIINQTKEKWFINEVGDVNDEESGNAFISSGTIKVFRSHSDKLFIVDKRGAKRYLIPTGFENVDPIVKASFEMMVLNKAIEGAIKITKGEPTGDVVDLDPTSDVVDNDVLGNLTFELIRDIAFGIVDGFTNGTEHDSAIQLALETDSGINELESNIAKRLRSLGVQEIAESDAKKSGDLGIRDAMELNPSAKIGTLLNLELSRIPYVDNENPVVDGSRYIPKVHNAKSIKNTLWATLADTTPSLSEGGDLITIWDSMSKKLLKMGEANSEFLVLRNRLLQNPSARDNFIHVFSQSTNNFEAQGLQEVGEKLVLKVSDTKTANSTEGQMIEDWNNSFLNKFFSMSRDANSFIKNEALIKEVSAEHERLKKSDDYTSADIDLLYRKFGIVISESAVEEINSNNNSLIYDKEILGHIIKSLKEHDRVSTETPSIMSKESSGLKKIASIAKYSKIDSMDDYSQLGPDGKKVYAFSNANFIDDFFNRAKSENDFSQLESFYRHGEGRGSRILEYILGYEKEYTEEERLELRKERISNISIKKILFAYKGRVEKPNKKLRAIENEKRSINSFAITKLTGHALNYAQEGLTASDKSTTLGISGIPVLSKTFLGSALSPMDSDGNPKSKIDVNGLLSKNGMSIDNLDGELSPELIKVWKNKILAKGNIVSKELAYSSEHIYRILKSVKPSKDRTFNDEFKLSMDRDREFNAIPGYNVLKDGGITVGDITPESLASGMQFTDESLNSDMEVLEKHLLMVRDSGAKAYSMGEFFSKILDYPTYLESLRDEKVSKSIDKSISDNLKASMLKEIQKMLNKGIISVDTNGNIATSNDAKSTTLILPKEGSIKENANLAEEIIIDYIFNRQISTHEYMVIFHGSEAFFKSGLEMIKRVPAAYADGKRLNVEHKKDVNFGAAIINDVNAKSVFLDKIISSFNQSDPSEKEMYKGYSSINRADGWGLITPNRWKFIMKKSGKWSPSMDSVFDKMVNRPFELDSEDIKILMQPVKGVYYDVQQDGPRNKPVYFKYSQFVIIPGVAGHSDSLLKKMDSKAFNEDGTYNTSSEEGSEIDEVIFVSGNKAGAQNISTVFDDNGNYIEDSPLNRNEYSNLGYRIQQDLPAKGHHATSIGSQIQREILYNFDINKEYEISGVGLVKGDVLIKELFSLFAAKSDNAIKDVLKRYGKDISGVTVDKSTFMNAVMDQLKDTTPETHMELLYSTGDISVTPQLRDKINKIIASEITKAVTKIKTNGGSMIQASGAFTDLSNVDQSKVLFFKTKKEMENERLSPMIIEKDGKMSNRAQVLMPFNIIQKIMPQRKDEDLEDYKARFILNSKGKGDINIDPEIFKGLIGYRIPTQAMSSLESIDVVGILPPTMGDTIILYDEIVVKSGSDFDIDKMYMMIPEYNIEVSSAKSVIGNMMKSKTFNIDKAKELLKDIGYQPEDMLSGNDWKKVFQELLLNEYISRDEAGLNDSIPLDLFNNISKYINVNKSKITGIRKVKHDLFQEDNYHTARIAESSGLDKLYDNKVAISESIDKLSKEMLDISNKLNEFNKEDEENIDSDTASKDELIQRKDEITSELNAMYSSHDKVSAEIKKVIRSQNSLELLSKMLSDGSYKRQVDLMRVNNKTTEEDIENCKGGGSPKAKDGMQSGFKKGGKWRVVKDLKGHPSHKSGGVQLSINKGNVSFTKGDSSIHAAHGMVIPNNPPIKDGGDMDYSFVDNKNDKSYKTYNDSLKLHNYYKNVKPNANNVVGIGDNYSTKVYVPTSDGTNRHISYRNNRPKKDIVKDAYDYASVDGNKPIGFIEDAKNGDKIMYPQYAKPKGKMFLKGTPEYANAKKQESLGVTVDGIWGDKSQAAYDKANPKKETIEKVVEEKTVVDEVKEPDIVTNEESNSEADLGYVNIGSRRGEDGKWINENWVKVKHNE